MIARLAEWYLWKRGRIVLRPTFNGLVLGNCYVKSIADNIYEVTLPHGGGLVMLNHSVLDAKHKMGPIT